MIALDLEESNERFLEMDVNQDNLVTWEEYLQESFDDADSGYEVRMFRLFKIFCQLEKVLDQNLDLKKQTHCNEHLQTFYSI